MDWIVVVVQWLHVLLGILWFGDALVLDAAALLLAAAAVPSALGWLGIAGGAGLAVSSIAFPLLGREHPVLAVAGLVVMPTHVVETRESRATAGG